MWKSPDCCNLALFTLLTFRPILSFGQLNRLSPILSSANTWEASPVNKAPCLACFRRVFTANIKANFLNNFPQVRNLELNNCMQGSKTERLGKKRIKFRAQPRSLARRNSKNREKTAWWLSMARSHKSKGNTSWDKSLDKFGKYRQVDTSVLAWLVRQTRRGPTFKCAHNEKNAENQSTVSPTQVG